MSVLTAVSIGSAALGAIGFGTGIAGGRRAKKELRKQKRVARRAENYRWREELEDLRQQERRLSGTQTANIAGSGAQVGFGTAKDILEETETEFRRLRETGSELHHQRLRSISANSIPGPAYASGAAQVLGGIGSALKTYRDYG